MTTAGTSLTEILLERLPPPLRAAFEAVPDLEARVRELSARARAAWPELSDPGLTAHEFVAHLGDKLAASGDGPEALETLAAGDLFLARAAAGGSKAAAAHIEQVHFPAVEAAVRSVRGAESLVADVKQVLRWDLFLPGPAGAPSKLASFDGRGALRSWLCVSAVRAAGKLLRPTRRELPNDGRLLEAGVDTPGTDDPELGNIRRLEQPEFKDALRAAVSALDARDRLLLTQHYLEGLSIDRLGELHGVHRATAARWLEKARAALKAQTRKLLAQRLGLDRQGCDSFVRLVLTDLQVTFSGLRKS